MMKAFKTAYSIYLKEKKYPQALRVAQKVNDMNMIKEVMDTAEGDSTAQK